VAGTVVIEHALQTNSKPDHHLFVCQTQLLSEIPCLRIDQSRKQNAAKRFRSDPGILVLLLHGWVVAQSKLLE
jgi:hypothetical protein